jgi:hypothetical protein
MHSRFLAAVTVVGLALAGCASDGDDDDSTTTQGNPTSTALVDDDTGTIIGGADSTEAPTPTDIELLLADDAPDGADIVIEAAGTTIDRAIRRGGQSAIEQGQTFAVDSDTTLTGVSFLVVAPDGVTAGTPVELAVYEVGNTEKMVPSGPVDLGSGTGGLVVSLPETIDPDAPTHLVFSLPDVAVSPGQYAVVLSFAQSAAPSEMFLQHPDGDVYAEGVAISLEGEFWKSDTNDHDSAVTITFGS